MSNGKVGSLVRAALFAADQLGAAAVAKSRYLHGCSPHF